MRVPDPAVLLTVRTSREDDVAAIAAIYRHHVLTGLASFEEAPPDLDEMTRRRAAIVVAGMPWLVATDPAGLVLGYAYAGPYRPRPGYRYTAEDSVYVGPRAVGRGVGRALLAVLVDRCEAMGFRQLVAVIGDSGNAASIGLHRALGFERVGLLPAVGFKFGRWVDGVLMQRGLGPGAATLPDRPRPA
ncbi:GNAT family N-acetyltransferase [Elioraea sp.]|uniref:GNAT family N-acetyltransferase n=1 Tax=Elioraea sp. TaxID=2185103 RepID=UPI003F6F8CC1